MKRATALEVVSRRGKYKKGGKRFSLFAQLKTNIYI